MPDMTSAVPWLLAMGSGGLVALLLTVFGGGGSVLAVPLLLYVVGVTDAHVAIGVSAAGVALNALTSLAGQAKAGRVKWPCAIVFAFAGVLGAWIGAAMAKNLSGPNLTLAFSVAMMVIAIAMLRSSKDEGEAGVRITRTIAPRLVGMGSGVGAAAGFFGIGGGFLVVPGLMSATGMTLAAAQATSLVSVAAFGATTAFSYALSNLISWPLVVAMAAGGVVGTLAGLPLSRKLSHHARLGRKLFAGLILLTAAYVMWRTLA